jgi:hypothetical protein
MTVAAVSVPAEDGPTPPVLAPCGLHAGLKFVNHPQQSGFIYRLA